MVWSQHASQVVSRLLARVLAEDDRPIRMHAARLEALPIGASLWADCYLRPNGEVVVVGEELERPDTESVYSDRVRVLQMLVWGSRRYPELRELLPEREPGAIDCMCLQHPDLFGPDRVICSECGGVGWLPGEPG